MLHRFFHFLKQSLLVVLCILLLGGLLAGGWFFYQGRQLYRSAASSYPVASMYDTICARGSYTSYDALPQIYINAVICTEDEHFMTHKGIDPGAIARALSAADQTRRGVLFCGIWFGKGGIMLPVQAVAAPPVGSIIIPKNFCESMLFI